MRGSTAVIGCLNDDDFGCIITSEMEKAGVKCFFQIKKEKPTGTCLVICNADNRLHFFFNKHNAELQRTPGTKEKCV